MGLPRAKSSDDPAASTASLERLRVEVLEVDARARLGGVFYLAAWLLVAAAAGDFEQEPLRVAVLLALFAALAAARFLLRPPAEADESLLRRLMHLQWAVVMATAALWSIVAGAVFLWPELAGARGAALICSIFFATAFAHTFAMHVGFAALGMMLVYLPSVLLVDANYGGVATQFALACYAVYLLGTLLRSHRDYRRRLALEDDLREQRDLFRRLSQIDGLTGLFNRAELSGRVALAFAEHARQRVRHALILLDVDHFKHVNDRLGHAAGDRCLIALSERLRRQFESVPGAAIGRWGGEEFAVLLPASSETAARIAAETVLDDLRRHPLLDDQPAITASFGVGELLPRHTSPEAWMGEVDRVLYAAKDAGRACVRGLGELDPAALDARAAEAPGSVTPRAAPLPR